MVHQILEQLCFWQSKKGEEFPANKAQ